MIWSRARVTLWRWAKYTAGVAAWVAVCVGLIVSCGQPPENPNEPVLASWCRSRGWIDPADMAGVGREDPDAP